MDRKGLHPGETLDTLVSNLLVADNLWSDRDESSSDGEGTEGSIDCHLSAITVSKNI